MRDQLLDLIKQSGSTFDIIRVVGTDEETRFSSSSIDNTFFMRGKFKEALLDMRGEFGISNLGQLSGLLAFTPYQTEDSGVTVVRRSRDGQDIVEKIRFSDGRDGESTFNLIDPKNIAQQVEISNIPWEVVIDIARSKIDELSKLTSLFGELKSINVKTKGDKLMFSLGSSESNKTNSTKMVFAEGLKSVMKGELDFGAQMMITMLKATGNYPSTLGVISRGVAGIKVETQYGVYEYFLRAKKGD